MIRKNPPKNKPLPARPDGSMPPMRLATPREACAYARVGHTFLYQLINAGRITAYKRDKRTLIDLDSIDAMHAAMPRIEPRTTKIEKAKTTRRAAS